MKSIKYILLGALLGLLFSVGLYTYAQIGGGIPPPTYWYGDGVGVFPVDPNWHLCSTGTRCAKIWAEDIDIAGVFTLGGVAGSNFDLDGYSLITDADGDTWIQSYSDNVISFAIGGASTGEYLFSGTEFDLNDNNLTTTGRGYFGSTYKASLGGYGFSSGYFEGNNTLAVIGSTDEAGYFENAGATNTVALGNVSYSVEAVGDASITGDLTTIGDIFSNYLSVNTAIQPNTNKPIAIFCQDGVTPEQVTTSAGSGKAIIVYGSNSAYILARAVDSNTEFYMGISTATGNPIILGSRTANNLDFRTNNASTLYLVSSTKDVGIGTIAPIYRLQVKDFKDRYVYSAQSANNDADTWTGYGFQMSTTDSDSIVTGIRAYRRTSVNDIDMQFWGNTSLMLDIDSSTGNFDFQAGNITTTGDIHIASDTGLFRAGVATTDYTFGWDGSDAVHTIATGDFVFSGGNVGIGLTSPTAKLHLPAGTASANTAPLKFTAGTALGTPECGALEFNDGRFYITNVAHQRAIDRTSDVAVETVTVANTTTETTLWTGSMPANSLVAGNIFMFHADGIVSNGGSASEADQIKIRVKIGGVEKVILEPSTKALDGDYWHIEANATQRTIGENGSRAIHIHLQIDDVETKLVGVIEINTEANMDVTITAQWGSAKLANTISLYQGFMRYKN